MPSTSPAERRIPRWKVIYDILYAELPRYDYGSSFYTLDDICRKFSVSLITARRVLDELEAVGMVQKIRKRGTIVRRTAGNVTVRLLISGRVPSDFQSFDHINRRLVLGAMGFAQRHDVEFDTLSEGHVRSLLEVNRERFGILVPSGLSAETRRFIRDSGMPYVLLDPPGGAAGHPHAKLDRFAAGVMATEHLIQLGHRRIAFLSGHLHQPGWRQRIKGYRHALNQAGVPFDWSRIRQTRKTLSNPRSGLTHEEMLGQAHDNYLDQIDHAFGELIDTPRPPTAIIAGDDNRAIRLLELCRHRGLRVPEDISIIGFPNYPESKLTHPPLTVIDAGYEKVGEEAMRLLVSRILENKDPARQSIVIPPVLVVRGSTGPAPIRRRTTAAAVAEMTADATTK